MSYLIFKNFVLTLIPKTEAKNAIIMMLIH